MVRAVRTGAAVGRGAPLRYRRCGKNSARVTGAWKMSGTWYTMSSRHLRLLLPRHLREHIASNCLAASLRIGDRMFTGKL